MESDGGWLKLRWRGHECCRAAGPLPPAAHSRRFRVRIRNMLSTQARIFSPAWMGLDAVAVLVFVVAGRRSHEEGTGLGEVASTAAPFLIALAVAWLVTRAWRRPVAMPTGLAVTAITVAGGMVLRRIAFGDGTAVSFILVATLLLTVFILGWRVAVLRFTPAG